jgi:ABC-2 type transport system ATP-binding protein
LTLNIPAENIISTWQSVEGVSHVSAENGLVTVLVDDSNDVLPRLFESATSQSARITSVDILEPNLEAVFLHLTGRALRD